MKLQIFRISEPKETEVIIRCHTIDAEVKAVSDFVRQFTVLVDCEENGEKRRIPPGSIYYADTVDGKTFVYTKNQVLFCRETLSSLEFQLKNTPVTRISKSCLLNTACLKSVQPYANHRLKAELSNGESLIVSRKYIESLKNKIRSERASGKEKK